MIFVQLYCGMNRYSLAWVPYLKEGIAMAILFAGDSLYLLPMIGYRFILWSI